MGAASTLLNLLSPMCPVVGVAGPFALPASQYSFPLSPAQDASLWRIDFASTATAQQQTAAINTLSTFNPAGTLATAKDTYNAALETGLTTTWTTSTSLNGTYGLSDDIQSRMLRERLSFLINNTFSNGTNQLKWFDVTGTAHTLTAAQANALAKALWAYLDALWVAFNTAIGGGTPTWPPSSVTISA